MVLPGRCERMPQVHLETAIGQFDGTIGLVGRDLDTVVREAPSCGAQK
jgi:hypothetical protein